MVTYNYIFEELPVWWDGIAVALVDGRAQVDVHSDKVKDATIHLEGALVDGIVHVPTKTPLHELLLVSLQVAYDAGKFGPAQEPRTGHDENDEHRLTAADVI